MVIFVLQDWLGGTNAISALNPDHSKVYFLKRTSRKFTSPKYHIK